MNEREVLPVSRKDFLCSERYFVVVLVRVRLSATGLCFEERKEKEKKERIG